MPDGGVPPGDHNLWASESNQTTRSGARGTLCRARVVACASLAAIIAGQPGRDDDELTQMARTRAEGGFEGNKSSIPAPARGFRETLSFEQTRASHIRPYTCNLDHFRQSGNNSLERVFGATFR